MSDSILFSVSGGLARVTFNRPASLNAMDFAMGERWRDIARAVALDSTIGAVILDAAGPAFCAGGDVVAMSTSGVAGSAVTEAAGVIHEGIRIFTEIPVPIVAAVQGAVAGGGLGLMLTADYIVAADGAKFVSKYANIGLTPISGSRRCCPRRSAGAARCSCCCKTARSTPPRRSIGDSSPRSCRPPTSPPAPRRSRASGSMAPTAAFGQAKRLIHTGAARSFAENLDDEASTIGAAFDTADARARVGAFAAASATSRR